MDNTEIKEAATEEQVAGATPELDAALQRIAELEKQNDEYKDKMMRAMADAENTRRRAAKEVSDISKFAITNFAKNLLSVADNLGRALAAVSKEKLAEDIALKALFEGVEATERELVKVFEQNNITKIEALNQSFNPNLHEVLFETAVPGKSHGTIIQVMEEGYMISDRLLRPAKVGVAKEDSPAEGSIVNMEA